MKIFFITVLILISQNLFSQNKYSDSTRKIPFDTNKIKDAVLLSNTSEVFSYDSLYIWSDKRSLSEILDDRSGYFVNDFGLGGRNTINFSGYTEKEIGIFRDGIQINDNLFGGFDIQNISINEIDKIEEISNVSSFLYGTNSNGKAINVITKDFFQSKPFSQFRYSQDRFNSLFADVWFTLPFSKKFAWTAGINKHSIDGRYQNSEFDVWRYRTRLDFFPSPKLNIKLNFYYNKIKRELNEGLVYNPVEDSLASISSPVINFVGKEELENFYYDASVTGRFFKNKKSLTKIKLYSANSIRAYENTDSVQYGSFKTFFQSTKYHQIQYAADLKQNLNYPFSKNSSLDFLIGANLYQNYFDNTSGIYRKVDNVKYSLLFKSDFSYNNFHLSAFARADKHEDENYDSLTIVNYGTEASYKYLFKTSYLKFYGGINNLKKENDYPSSPIAEIGGPMMTYNYYEGGFELGLNKTLRINSYYFGNTSVFPTGTIVFAHHGINTNIILNSRYAEVNLSYNYWNSNFFPKNYLKADLSYHNYFFKNKLNIRVGITGKYLTSPDNFYTYSQPLYDFFYGIKDQIKKDNFSADLYLGARIGHANINLTIANVFNTISYNTFMFPLDNRGGFLNSISRFTIVWDFIN